MIAGFYPSVFTGSEPRAKPSWPILGVDLGLDRLQAPAVPVEMGRMSAIVSTCGSIE